MSTKRKGKRASATGPDATTKREGLIWSLRLQIAQLRKQRDELEAAVEDAEATLKEALDRKTSRAPRSARLSNLRGYFSRSELLPCTRRPSGS